jgi:hypothetical protein
MHHVYLGAYETWLTALVRYSDYTVNEGPVRSQYKCLVPIYVFKVMMFSFFYDFLALSKLKGQCHEIFCFWFFSLISSPKHLIIPIGLFRIFTKICKDIRSSKFATGVNDTDTGGKWKKPSSRKI